QDKPVLVVRYSKKWIVGWIIFLAFCLLVSGSIVLYYTQQPDESYYHYLFMKIGAWWFTVMIIYLYIDVLNTKRFEIYDDRIEKKVKVLKKLPILGDKVVYFDTAYFRYSGFGIVICNCRFLLIFRGIMFNIIFLSSEDVYKVAEILSQKSGREKWRFTDFGRSSFVKKFKKKRRDEFLEIDIF
ncbi:hypothetical protein, partial [Persephonella sp.]